MQNAESGAISGGKVAMTRTSLNGICPDGTADRVLQKDGTSLKSIASCAWWFTNRFGKLRAFSRRCSAFLNGSSSDVDRALDGEASLHKCGGGIGRCWRK